MNERKDDEALRALFTAQDAPGDGAAFIAAVNARIRAERARMRERVQAFTIGAVAFTGALVFPYLGVAIDAFADALAKSTPSTPVIDASIDALMLALAAALAAYFVAERA